MVQRRNADDGKRHIHGVARTVANEMEVEQLQSYVRRDDEGRGQESYHNLGSGAAVETRHCSNEILTEIHKNQVYDSVVMDGGRRPLESSPKMETDCGHNIEGA